MKDAKQSNHKSLPYITGDYKSKLTTKAQASLVSQQNHYSKTKKGSKLFHEYKKKHAATNSTTLSLLAEMLKRRRILNRKQIPFTKKKSAMNLDLKLSPQLHFPPVPIMDF